MAKINAEERIIAVKRFFQARQFPSGEQAEHAGFKRPCSGFSEQGFSNEEHNQHPHCHGGDGIVPFLRPSLLPHPLRPLSAGAEYVLRNTLYRQGNQERQQNHVIQIAQNRNEIRNQVQGRQGAGHGDFGQNFGGNRGFLGFQRKKHRGNVHF